MHMDSYNPFCEVDGIILDLVGFMSVVCRYLSYKMMYLMTESLPLIWMLLTMYRLHHKKVIILNLGQSQYKRPSFQVKQFPL